MKKAFITGITGQDGSYLAELLLQKGYEVHGLVRRSSHFMIHENSGVVYKKHENSNLQNHNRLHLYYGDLSDFSSLSRCLYEIQPDEVYNLGAMSDVRISFDVAEYTANITGLGTLRMLEAIKNSGFKKIKFYQASSSEIFGKVQEIPQKETTPFYPRSPYAVSKVFAHWICKNYRESYGMFISNGILFNHESPRRGPNFVTRKITQGIGRILAGRQEKIYLGNLDAKRDWGYAPEYVEAMWLMLQHKTPDDYVIATGETHTVREFLEEAFTHVGLKWRNYVEIKKSLFRPAETDVLLGDASKARRELKWKPRVSFRELVKILLDADIATARAESLLKKNDE